jgi:hypothetical protein
MTRWLADTHAIAHMLERKPTTIRSWALRYRDQMPRRGTGKHKRALYDVEEAEEIAVRLAQGGNTRRTVQH